MQVAREVEPAINPKNPILARNTGEKKRRNKTENPVLQPTRESG